MDFKTLEQMTDALKALGFQRVRMIKAWKRKDHREVLISGWFERDLTITAKEQMKQLETVLRESMKPFNGEEYFPLYFHKGDRFIELDCYKGRVDLP